MKILNVAEKPSAAKEIAQILSNKTCRSREGKSPYNKIWDFKLDILNQKNCDMIFTSVTGHLMETDVEEVYKPWNSCQPIDLFQVPIRKIVSHDKLNIKNQLEIEIRKCDALILWLDCDREGENIAFEVLTVCNSAKRLPKTKIYRAIFSAIIPREVNRAIANLKQPNERDSIAVDTRIEIDLRLGAAFTRFQTLYLKKFQLTPAQEQQFQQQQKNIISYGPCQFPTLGFVVERYFRKTNFIKESFWSIVVYDSRTMNDDNDDSNQEQDDQDGKRKRWKKEKNSIEFKWKRKRLFDYPTSYIFYEKCLDNPLATVVDININESTYRPVPLTTIELQKQASKKLRLSSAETMQIAEELYNKGLISYPRTETDTFPQGTDFKGLIQMQTSHPDWGQYAQRLNAGEFKYPRSGTNNDNSHPPIHPSASATSLAGKQKQLYEFITRRFLACCSTESILGNTTVTIDIQGEQFSETGVMVKHKGYLEVYPYDKRTDKTIPKYRVGEQFQPEKIELIKGETQPPHFLTESELLSAMDKNKIGTDATMATHIQTIQDRGYVIKNPDNQFEPTKLGISLVVSYELMGFQFSKPELRAQIEADVNEISRGRKEKKQVLDSTIEKYKQLFEMANQNLDCFDKSFSQFYGLAEPQGQTQDFHIEHAQFIKCGKCNNKMDYKSDRNPEQAKRILFCSTCKESFDLPVKGIITPFTEADPILHQTSVKYCPICKYQVVNVFNEEKQSSYQICPKCRNNPPFPDKKKPFHCFQCNFDCNLAKNINFISSNQQQQQPQRSAAYRNTNTSTFRGSTRVSQTSTRGRGSTTTSTRGRPTTTSTTRGNGRRVFTANNSPRNNNNNINNW